MKECKLCKETKSLDQFHPHNSCKLGVRPDCKSCHNKISKVKHAIYIKVNPLNRRSTILKNKYGINYDDYLRILGTQGSGCAICGSSNPGAGKTYFSVDHNHKTGQNRGLLCHPCNAGLGMFKEDKLSLNLAVEYLEKWNG